MNTTVWSLCVLMGFVAGALAWELARQRYFLPPPQFVPVKIVKPAPVELSHANIWTREECRRICYGRIKSAQVEAK